MEFSFRDSPNEKGGSLEDCARLQLTNWDIVRSNSGMSNGIDDIQELCSERFSSFEAMASIPDPKACCLISSDP